MRDTSKQAGPKKAGTVETAVADRRNFMKLAGATAAGAGATVATSGVVQAADAKPTTDELYRETAHIKRYYDSAR